MNLRELTDAYRAIYASDDDQELVQSMLDGIGDAIEKKATNIGFVIQQLKADAVALDSEIKRLEARKKAAVNKENRLKDYLHESMVALGTKKINTPVFSFTVQRNSPSVRIIDESKIIADHYRIKKELDKKAIKEALKRGEKIEGAELVQTESLRIR